MLADPAAPPLTLRGVARAVGVAATSVYLHFDNVEALVLEVARRGFGELRAAQEAAMDPAAAPCERLRARSLAYCDWAMANPGHYQWMFANPMRISASSWEGLPGQPQFAAMVAAVAECLGRPPADPESATTARRALAPAARDGQPADSAAVPPLGAHLGNRRRGHHPARRAGPGLTHRS